MKLNLILVIILEISFCLSVFSIETNDVYCDSIDIRNDPQNFEKLRNCTVVDGNVHIILMEKHRNVNFSAYQFPELKVITGYLLIHRVPGLRTLEHLMPNLLVIRGEQLISHYALAIYEAIDMIDVGLKSLVKIQHGFVLIRNVSMLCFSDTIDWKQLTPPQINGGWGNLINIRHVSDYVHQCPTITACSFCGPNGTCWNRQHCQKFDDGYSDDRKIKCHPECLGGCSGPTAYNCSVCRNFRDEGRCVEKCPDTKYRFYGRNECVTKSTCIENQRIPYQGECRKECPPNFTQYNPDRRGEKSNDTCYPCYTNCLKVCEGFEIESISSSDYFQGCQIVNGSLFLKLRSGMAETERILKRNLGDIEEIRGYLKVYRSPAIESLSFFEKLHTIHGETLGVEKYALYIVSNSNLQTIWDYNKKRNTVKIVRGSLLFQDNGKLCLNNIYNWNNSLVRTPESLKDDVANIDSNGYDQSCTARIFNSSQVVISDTEVDIIWDTFVAPLNQVVVGYLVYFVEAPERNVTLTGIDSCVTYGWKSEFVQNATADKSGLYQKFRLGNLTQNTQYAYYIKTQAVSMKNEGNITNIVQGQSDICYFRTNISMPSPPIVKTVKKTNSSILVEWFLIDDQEVIDHFLVDIFIQPDDRYLLESRNYCEHPRIITQEKEEVIKISIKEQPRKSRSNCREKFSDDYGMNDDYNFGYSDQPNKNDCSTEKIIEEVDVFDSCSLNQCPDAYESLQFKREIDEHLSKSKFDYNESTEETISKRNIMESPYFKYHQANYLLSKDETRWNFLNLSSYTLYTMHFFSCNSKGCSPYFMYNERTNYSEFADNIDFDILLDENDVTTIHLVFGEPKAPNGLTVAFHIEKLDKKNSTSETICISRKQHDKNNQRYTFTNLESGRYGFRVRSISLAFDGYFSDFKYVTIYKSETWPSSLVATTLGFLLLLMCGWITTLLYKVYRKRVPHPVDIDRQNILENEILPHTLYDDDPFYMDTGY